jgi:hypothetical protein
LGEHLIDSYKQIFLKQIKAFEWFSVRVEEIEWEREVWSLPVHLALIIVKMLF